MLRCHIKSRIQAQSVYSTPGLTIQNTAQSMFLTYCFHFYQNELAHDSLLNHLFVPHIQTFFLFFFCLCYFFQAHFMFLCHHLNLVKDLLSEAL